MDGASLSQTGREDKGGIANDTIYLYLNLSVHIGQAD